MKRTGRPTGRGPKDCGVPAQVVAAGVPGITSRLRSAAKAALCETKGGGAL